MSLQDDILDACEQNNWRMSNPEDSTVVFSRHRDCIVVTEKAMFWDIAGKSGNARTSQAVLKDLLG